jgi:dihydrofolate reductase
MAPGPRLALIYARAANGVIGRDGLMPWHLPEDLARFRALTQGHPVIMGRKTWDSLPDRFRPLPGRRNIVLTRQHRWQAVGAEKADSLQQALALCAEQAEVWVIGGAQIYAQALPIAHRIEVTEIDRAFEGDAFAPELDPGWRETSRQQAISASGLPYSFVSYRRA